MNYFDFAATCPLDDDALKTYIHASTEYFGNSHSLHDTGDKARQLLENCRLEMARLLQVEKEGIFFTSGGSESNYLAIESLISGLTKKGNHIISSVAEHGSVHSTLERLKSRGFEITYLSFTKEGVIDLDEFRSSLKDETVLAVIQHGNSEIGTIQPIVEIGQLCINNGILLHTDCVQTFWKVNLKSITVFVDSLSVSGHKVYGPKGTGALYIRPDIAWKPVFPNTSHEKGMRPGTVNVPGIAAMTVAAKKMHDQLARNTDHFQTLRQQFIDSFVEFNDHIVIYGSSGNQQLSSIIGMNLSGIEGQWVLLECNRQGFAISTGSACHSGMQSPSNTMKALGFSGKKAKEFFRVSLGVNTTVAEINDLARALIKIIN
jgi:cysteine desulfurase